MGDLYRLNSLFELEISQYPKTLDFDKLLLERSTAFEYLFLLISQPEDYVLLSETPSENYLEYLEKRKFLYGKNIQINTPYFENEVVLNGSLPQTLSLIEWGNTSRLNREGILEKKEDIILRSRFLNSKINQTRWKESHELNRLTSVICINRIELESFLSLSNPPIVVKAEFGFSGRGHFILRTKVDVEGFSKKIDEIFRVNPRGVIIEEWVEERRNQDFSGLFDVSESKSKLLAVTKMLVGRNGIYRGSIIQKNFGKEFESGMSSIIDSYFYEDSAYKGALSIDGFTFRKNENIEVQYMSEINFRCSMGRVLFDIHKKLGGENDEYALLFFPVRNKDLTFENLISNLTKIEAAYKSEILLVTPLTNFKLKNNQFLGFYVSNTKTIPADIFDRIEKILL